MKQFKAEWQHGKGDIDNTIHHIITQHNALCDYLEGQAGERCAVCRGPASEDHTACSKIDKPTCGFCGGKNFCVCVGKGTPGGAGYDPRYEGGKPSFSEAYKNKTEEQMLDVARQATLLQNATYTSDDGWHITLPKPDWWGLYFSIHPEASDLCRINIQASRKTYLEALSDTSKALGVEIKLEE